MQVSSNFRKIWWRRSLKLFTKESTSGPSGFCEEVNAVLLLEKMLELRQKMTKIRCSKGLFQEINAVLKETIRTNDTKIDRKLFFYYF